MSLRSPFEPHQRGIPSKAATTRAHATSSRVPTLNSQKKAAAPRGIDKEKLKTTKFVVNKKKTVVDDLRVESPEFDLLVKLFIPLKYLIQNDKLSLKQLSNHLPVLINERYPKLNIELHLFLSSITTNYISSWYLKKLNTDNLDFIHHVYAILCDFVRDFARRVSTVLDLDKTIPLFDELCGITNDHLKDTVSSSGVPKVIEEYKLQSRNIVVAEKSNYDILQNYLRQKHVIFDKEVSGEVSHNFYDEDYYHTSTENDSIAFRSPENETDPQHLIYFRVLVSKILTLTFQPLANSSKSPGPLNSKITMALVIHLVADLVLEKVFGMLSSPDFFLENIDRVVNSICTAIDSRDRPKTSEKIPTTARVKAVLSVCYGYFSSLIVSISPRKAQPEKEAEVEFQSVLDSSLFSLVNTVTNFASRRPLVSYVLQSVKTVILSSSTISRKVDTVVRSYIWSKVNQSLVTKDDTLALVVKHLNLSLFDKDERVEKEKVTQDLVTDKILHLVNHNIPSLVKLNKNILSFKNEDSGELRTAIEGFLSVFTYIPDQSPNQVSDLNRLLIINYLDCIVAKLYPELLE